MEAKATLTAALTSAWVKVGRVVGAVPWTGEGHNSGE